MLRQELPEISRSAGCGVTGSASCVVAAVVFFAIKSGRALHVDLARVEIFAVPALLLGMVVRRLDAWNDLIGTGRFTCNMFKRDHRLILQWLKAKVKAGEGLYCECRRRLWNVTAFAPLF